MACGKIGGSSGSFITRMLRPALLRFGSTACRRQFSSQPPRANLPLPFITEVGAGGWRTSDIFSKLLQERVIYLSGAVDNYVSASVIAQLLWLEADNPEKGITMYINSPGGSVSAGLAIYDTMNYIQSPVSTIALGQAASMGSLLLVGGEPGKRYCLPHSSIMLHQPSGGYSGQASDIAIHATEILRVRKALNEIYKKHLTKPHTVEEIERLLDRDKYLNATEALEMGLIDQVMDKRPVNKD